MPILSCKSRGDRGELEDRRRASGDAENHLADEAPRAAGGDRPPRSARLAWCVLGLLVLLLPTVAGCSGCRRDQDPAREESEEDKEKPKPDFEVARLYVQPSDSAISRNAVKPGHYVLATQQMKANNFDFRAVLETASVTSEGQPLPVDDTPFTMLMSRPAILPKGQVKNFRSLYFIPRRSDDDLRTVWLQSRLTRGGREFSGSQQPTTRMPDYQYYFLTLAGDPDRYGYLKQLDSVELPKIDFLDEDQLQYYRVVLPKLERDPPVPSNALALTTVAYILWDEVNPVLFDRDQQRALIDWLHWGGQIIISGPNSLDLLRGSFLDAYLPADAGSARELRQADFAELNAHWSLSAINPPRQLTLDVLDEKPLVGVDLDIRPEAEPMPHTGELVAERQVGAGRIVVTAFPLAAPNVVNWGSFDSFFNTCLLRRPARVWEVKDATARLHWAGRWRSLDRDATLATGIRYFSRDIGRLTDTALAEPTEEPIERHWRRLGYRNWAGSGLGGWNDYSGVSEAVRSSLKDAAGISIPKAGFVFRVLAVYLVVLVPLNWALFRLIGRVEWAWAAAPLIAVVGAVAVVRLAQLDIGFARSRTELATLELHGDYPRGHLTRYSALYTSLSTSYDLEFDDPTALAQPFPSQRSRYSSHRPVMFYEEGDKTRLSGLQVDSNSTGLVHSEQMYDLQGGLRLAGNLEQGLSLENNTELNLRDVGVLHRTADGLRVAWLGDLAPRTARELAFRESDTVWLSEWNESPVTLSHERQARMLIVQGDLDENRQLDPKEFAALGLEEPPPLEELDEDGNELLSYPELVSWGRRARSGEISIGRLMDLASGSLLLREGDMRLLAWTDQELPGVTYRPRASQAAVRLLVLAHLRRAPLPEPDRDVNCRQALNVVDQDEDEFDVSPQNGPGPS